MILLVAAKLTVERTLRETTQKLVSSESDLEQLTEKLAEKEVALAKALGNQFLVSKFWI